MKDLQNIRLSIETLRMWSQILLWISVTLPVLAALATGARYYIEKTEKQLSSIQTAQQIQRVQTNAELARRELAKVKEENKPRRLTEAEKEKVLPYLNDLHDIPLVFAGRLMDGEACDFADDIASFFKKNGCRVFETIKTSLVDQPGFIVICDNSSNEIGKCEILQRAFTAAGLDSQIKKIDANQMGTWYLDTIHVIISRKVVPAQ